MEVGTAIETPKALAITPYERLDAEGNLVKVDGSRAIYLSLKAQPYPRMIGQLLLHKGRLVLHKDLKRGPHFHRKHKAWGFHHAVLELDGDVWLRVFCEDMKYAIRVEDARKVAIFEQYDGFEKQAFIPLASFMSRPREDKPKEIA